MDQGAGKIDRPSDSVRVRGTGFSATPPSDTEEVPVEEQEIQRTRAHMSETIEEIQERLVPERVAEEAKETADHVIEEVRTTAEEWGELARVAALETVDYAIGEAKAVLPTVSEQAQELAQATIDHAIVEAKAAVRELAEGTRLAVRDATIGKVERMAQTTSESTKSMGSSLLMRVKQNPGPAALAGLGIGWLMMSGKGSSSSEQSTTGTQFQETTGATTGQLKDSASQAKDKAAGVAEGAQDAAGKAVEGAQQAASAVTDQTKQAASTVSGQAQQVTGNLSSQVRQLSVQLRQKVDQNPLGMGAIAVAVGSAAALAVPATQKEQQLLGGTRDKLVERAETGAQDLVQKVQRVAEEAGEAAEKEAKYQGLSSEG